MSFVITPGVRPAAMKRGTSASVRAVFPVPTGPPMPTRRTLSLMCMPFLSRSGISAGEQARLGALVGCRHDVGDGREPADVVGRPYEGIRDDLGDHGLHAP